MREPCTHCPWRVGVDAWAIGRDHTMAVPPLHRAEMAMVAAVQRKGLGRMMACHLTFKGEDDIAPQERICVGYALSAGGNCGAYRLAVMTGAVDPSEFHCAEELHPSFGAMLAANPPRKAGS